MITPKHTYEIIQTNSLTKHDEIISHDYEVNFRVTDACNLKCHYCEWNKGPQYKTPDIIKTADLMFEFFSRRNFGLVNIYLHGGEPTTHKDLFLILDHIKTKSVKSLIEIQTNLTPSLDYVKEMVNHVDFVSISFHYTELVRKRKLEQFIGNVKYLQSIDFPINNFDIMLEDVSDPEYHDIITDLIDHPCVANSEMIYGYYKHGEVTSQKEFYTKHNKSEQQYKIDGTVYNTNELFTQGLNCKDWMCDVTKESLYINGNGDVFTCASNMSLTEPFTNIIHDSNALAKLSIITKNRYKCKWEVCCGDYFIDKNPTTEITEDAGSQDILKKTNLTGVLK